MVYPLSSVPYHLDCLGDNNVDGNDFGKISTANKGNAIN
jgi:hypothetical protein